MSTEVRSIDLRDFRRCMGRFATGVTILTSEADGEVRGMTANAFMSVSLTPPTVLVSVSHKAHMHVFLQQTKRYGVSILAESQIELSNHFAGRNNPALKIPFVRHADMPLIEGAVAHVVAKVIDTHVVGDHTLYIGEVEYLGWHDQQPLLFFAGNYSQVSPDLTPIQYPW